MSASPPPGWTRVLVRPRHRGDHRDYLLDLGAEWNPALTAWVLEPTPERRLNRETRLWEPARNDAEHSKLERALRDLGQVDLEWQVGGPSALPRGRAEDAEPGVRHNRGWKTPYFPHD